MTPQHDLETLKLVFAYHVVEDVVRSDVDSPEADLVRTSWPLHRLKEKGLLDCTGQPTVMFRQACSAAVSQLRSNLSSAEKLEVISSLVQVSLADGHVDRNETAAVSRAAKLLGVSSAAWMDHLTRLETMGELDELPEPMETAGHLSLADEDDDAVGPARGGPPR